MSKLRPSFSSRKVADAKVAFRTLSAWSESSLNRSPSPNVGLFPRRDDQLTNLFLRPVDLLQQWKLIFTCVLLGTAATGSYAIFKQDYYVAKVEVLSGQASDQAEFINASRDIVSFSLKMRQQLARLARLDAEIGRRDTIVFPPALASMEHESTTASLLKNERLIFSARRRALEESLKTLQVETRLSERRAASIEEQIRLAGTEIDAVEQEAESVRSLLSKQLVPAPRLLDLHRTAAVIASRKVELESELLEVRQRLETARQKVTDIVNAREIELLEERQQAVAELQEYELALATSTNLANKRDFGRRFDSGMLANEMDIITSDSLAFGVVKLLRLDESVGFAPGTESAAASSPEARALAAVEDLQRNLTARRIEPGSKIEIAYTSDDPEEAVHIANAIARVYVEGEEQVERDMTPSANSIPGAINPGNSGGGQIVRAARKPPDGAGPGDSFLVMGGLLLGLLCGCLLALLGQLKGRVRGHAQAAFEK